eukprot:6177716-Pleurochrysis_carterae.AAC.1
MLASFEHSKNALEASGRVAMSQHTSFVVVWRAYRSVTAAVDSVATLCTATPIICCRQSLVSHVCALETIGCSRCALAHPSMACVCAPSSMRDENCAGMSGQLRYCARPY